MRIDINKVMGVNSLQATISDGTVTAVVGENEAGKSSLLYALGAALTHNKNPLGLQSAQMVYYGHHGAESPRLLLNFDADNELVWRPGEDITLRGNFEPQNPMTVQGGWGALKPADRMKHLSEIFAPHQTEEEVEGALSQHARDILPTFPEGVLPSIVETVVIEGWGKTCDQWKQLGRQAKERWEKAVAATGERKRFGTKVAAEWLPKHWSTGLRELSEADAKEIAQEAATQLEVVRRKMVSATRFDKLERDLHDVQDAMEASKSEIAQYPEDLEERYNKAQEQATLYNHYLNSNGATVICPACDNQFQWEMPEELAVAGPKAVEEASNLLREMGELQSEKESLKALESKFDTLHEQIRDKTSDEEDKEGHADSENAWMIALEKANKDLESVVSYRNAQKAAKDVMDAIAIVDMLDPSKGVPAAMTEKGVAKINRILAKISSACNWPPLKMEHDGGLTWGRYPYAVSAASVKWRADAAIALTLAIVTKAKVVILDDADVLDEYAFRKFYLFLKDTFAPKQGITVFLGLATAELARYPIQPPLIAMNAGNGTAHVSG